VTETCTAPAQTQTAPLTNHERCALRVASEMMLLLRALQAREQKRPLCSRVGNQGARHREGRRVDLGDPRVDRSLLDGRLGASADMPRGRRAPTDRRRYPDEVVSL
jgi:hypothetical protein